MGNETALAVIERATNLNALIFVNKENFQSQVELYRTEATIIQARPDEFHNISGKCMPNQAVTNRIGEATGINFIAENCTVRVETRDDEIAGKRTVFVSTSQGKVRMPDGGWRLSSVEEYEFDPVLRAMLEKNVTELNSTTRPLIARTVLEFTKVGRQRAVTGARLRVIRTLTGMPVTFTKEEITRPMVFSRIVQNTAFILSTPEGKMMATAQALGQDASSLLYGKRSQQIEQAPAIQEQTSELTDSDLKPADTSGFCEDTGMSPAELAVAAGSISPQQEFEDATADLEALIESNKVVLNIDTNGKNPYKLALAEIDDFAGTTESRKKMTAKLNKFITDMKERGLAS